jgi:type IV secretion system protein VirB10
MLFRHLISTALLAAGVFAQTQAPQVPADQPAPNQVVDQAAQQRAEFTVESGVKIPMSLINSISTKHSMEGDRVYLETAFPILANGRIVIPVGSYVAGTVTQIRKPGRIKGRGEIYVRFDTLTLPNGVTRDFRSRMGTMDASSSGKLDRSEGRVESEGDKLGDARTVAETTATGASVGSIAGVASKSVGMGLGIGAGAGAAAGLIAILAMRGPDAILAKGSTVEMILDRPLSFGEGELNFGNYQAPRMAMPVAQPEQAKSQLPLRK